MQSTNSVLSKNIIELKPTTVLSSSPFDQPEFELAIERRHDNRSTLLWWIKSNLVEGVDFGVIPNKKGAGKKCLFKSGAEKLCVLLGLTPTYPAFKDYEQAALSNQKLELIILRCELVNEKDVIVASGIGARAIKDDFGNVNKSLKMAAKSAAILATLSVAGLSEVFTLDLEPEEKLGTVPNSVISDEQLNTLNSLITQHSVPLERLLAWLNKVAQSRKLPPIQELSQMPTVLYQTTVSKLSTFNSTH
jgi:hypothetical protein